MTIVRPQPEIAVGGEGMQVRRPASVICGAVCLRLAALSSFRI
ncbi:MAG TPA: hypothetical protein VF186_10220 [Gaiellaceae bacterium]